MLETVRDGNHLKSLQPAPRLSPHPPPREEAPHQGLDVEDGGGLPSVRLVIVEGRKKS